MAAAEDGRKWCDSGYVLKVEPKEVAVDQMWRV